MLGKVTEAALPHLGDAVPQAPWDFALWSLKRQGHAKPGKLSPTHCSQASRPEPWSHPRRVSSSAGATQIQPPSRGHTTGHLRSSPFARPVSFC